MTTNQTIAIFEMYLHLMDLEPSIQFNGFDGNSHGNLQSAFHNAVQIIQFPRYHIFRNPAHLIHVVNHNGLGDNDNQYLARLEHYQNNIPLTAQEAVLISRY